MLAEGLATGLLVCCIIGSGIMAERLSPDDVGLQLLENVAAITACLLALICAFEPVSGAHLNPIFTVAEAVSGGLRWSHACSYVLAQGGGALFGAVFANVMFDLPPVNLSTQTRSTPAHFVSEIVATFGLVLLVAGLGSARERRRLPMGVAGYVAAACWFTSSAAFMNPTITAARSLTDTFTGIAPSSVPPYVLAQLLGALLALPAAAALWPRPSAERRVHGAD